MAVVRHTGGTHSRLVRSSARIIGATASVGWLFILISSLVVEGWSTLEGEGVVLGALILLAIIGVAVAFAAENSGGSIAFVAGLALSVFAVITAGRNHWLAVLVSGAPFVVSGALFIIDARTEGDVG